MLGNYGYRVARPSPARFISSSRYDDDAFDVLYSADGYGKPASGIASRPCNAEEPDLIGRDLQ